MENHIQDPKVNWNAIFDYLREVLKIVPDDEHHIKNEILQLLTMLGPYQDKLLTVYTGF